MGASPADTKQPKPSSTRAPMPGPLALFAVATFAGGLMFLRAVVDSLADGDTAYILRSLLKEFTGAYGAALLVPLIILAARRFRLYGRGLWLNLPVHLVLAGAVAALHTTVMWLSRNLLAPLMGIGDYEYGGLPMRYLTELPMQLAVYAATVALTVVFDRYRRLRDTELEAAQLRLRLGEAQLQQLSRQLGPHFLFNTLNAISELVYTRPAAAEEMIRRLTALLRHAFQPDQEPESTLGEELRVLDLYLDVMRLRFAERLFVRVDVPEELRSLRVPRLMLQPLVENALKHGSDPSLSLVSAQVSARLENDQLVIRVRDRGPEPGRGDSAARELGLRNLGERIGHLYGSEYGLSQQDAPEQGIEVTVRLPRRASDPDRQHRPASRGELATR